MSNARRLGIVGASLLAMASLAVRALLAASPESTLRWEEHEVGVDLGYVAESYEPAWADGSRFCVTSLLYSRKTKQAWAGTAAGIMLCGADGSNPVPITASPPPHPGNDVSVAAAELNSHRRNHCVILELVLLSNGEVWAKAVWGAYRLSPSGKVLEDWLFDSEVVERQYQLILRHKELQKWYPVSGKHVYLPWAGRKVARFDGRRWELLGDIPNDPDHYLPARRVYLVNEVPCVTRREGVGLLDVTARRVLFEAPRISSLAAHLDKDTAIGFDPDGSLWLLTSDRMLNLALIPSRPPRDLLHDGPGVALIGARQAATIGILELGNGKDHSVRLVDMPFGHTFRCFGSNTPDGSLLIGTDRGIASIDVGRRAVRVLKEIPVPAVPEFWAPAVRRGVAAQACAYAEECVLVGTVVGLVRFDPRTMNSDWVWKVE